jgi:hypothetical protein
MGSGGCSKRRMEMGGGGTALPPSLRLTAASCCIGEWSGENEN